MPIVVTQHELAVLSRTALTFFGAPFGARLEQLFPPAYVPPRYGSCAVVGSAGHLLGSGLGAQIDRAQVVWRFNEAPTTGFEQHVGVC